MIRSVNRNDRRFSNISSFIDSIVICLIISAIISLFLNSLLLWLFSFVIMGYISSLFTLNIFTLNDDYIEVCYPLRLFNRKRRIDYMIIRSVVYCPVVRYRGAVIGLLTTSDRINYSNSFSCFRPRRIMSVLKYLQLKGLKIDIRSDSERDNTILDK